LQPVQHGGSSGAIGDSHAIAATARMASPTDANGFLMVPLLEEADSIQLADSACGSGNRPLAEITRVGIVAPRGLTDSVRL